MRTRGERRRSPVRRAARGGCPRCTPSSPVLGDGTPSTKEKLLAVVRDPEQSAAAEVIPHKREGSVGRPRKHPDVIWVMWPSWEAIFGSHRAVERELGRGGWWHYIRLELMRLYPDLGEISEQPPRRQDYQYMRRNYLGGDDALSLGARIHAEGATRQAIEAGNLDERGAGSPTHPDITRTLYGDGKVITPLYRATPGTTTVNRETGEIREVRSDPDAAFHVEGGGDRVWGTKFATLATRREEGRFILAIDHVESDEAKVALGMLRRVRPLAPGAQALVWDMELRGKHLAEILRLGLVPVVKVPAKENPKGGKGRGTRTYVPKTVDLDDKIVVMPDGSTRVAHIASADGQVSIKEMTDTGDPYYEPLKLIRLQPHEDKNGYRWYGSYRLPDEYGGGEVSVRLHQNADDDRRRLNRTENVRPIPEGSKDFKRLHRLRPDAESINRGIEDALFIGRASAKGWRSQLVDLRGHARLVNAITLARCRARGQPVAA